MAKQGKVCIVPDEMGNVIRVSKNNPEYGHVRLTQDGTTFTQTGWIKKVTKSTLLHGTVEDLKNYNIQKKKTLQGNIYIVESFDPFSEKNPDYDLKMAGKTNIICKGINPVTGEIDAPIYRKSFYDPMGTKDDVLISHTNTKEIREANSDEVYNKLKAETTETEEVDPNQVDLEDAIEEVTNETDEVEETIEDNEEVVVEEEVEEEVEFNL